MRASSRAAWADVDAQGAVWAPKLDWRSRQAIRLEQRGNRSAPHHGEYALVLKSQHANAEIRKGEEAEYYQVLQKYTTR